MVLLLEQIGDLMQNRPKVVGVGFQKTGTSSLRDALKILGYKVGDNNFKLLPTILKKDWEKIHKKFQQFDAVEDNPWPLIYKELDKMEPGCKFVLTTRETNSWFKSVNRHIGTVRDPMHEWIYGRNKGLPSEDEANTKQVYEKHNQEVLEYFKDRKEDLLVLDLKDDGKLEKLCEFLKIDLPKNVYPHENDQRKEASVEPLSRKLKVIKKRIKYWIQIRFYRLKGWI